MLRPLPADKWNFTTAAHLLNPAGFGGTPPEIEKLLKLGPEKAVSHLVDFENIADNTADPSWAKPDPTRADRFLAARRAGEEERRKFQREEQRTQSQQIM